MLVADWEALAECRAVVSAQTLVGSARMASRPEPNGIGRCLWKGRNRIASGAVVAVLRSAIVVPLGAVRAGHDVSPTGAAGGRDAQHGLAACWARRAGGRVVRGIRWPRVDRRVVVCDLRGGVDRRESLNTVGQIALAVMVAEAAVAARLHEALRKDVLAPTADEFDAGQRDGRLLASAAGLVAAAREERDLAVGVRHHSTRRDRSARHVAGQIFQHVLGR